MQFSIKTLLVLTLFIAVISAAFVLVGPDALWLVVILALIAIGVTAHNNRKLIPFVCCLISIFAFLLAIPPPRQLLTSESDVVIRILIFVSGGYLAYAAIQRGHWATRMLALLVFLFYLVVFVTLTLTFMTSNK